MQPIGKFIVITKTEEEVKTESGILLSAEDVSSMRYQKANVVKPGTLVDTIKEMIIYTMIKLQDTQC